MPNEPMTDERLDEIMRRLESLRSEHTTWRAEAVGVCGTWQTWNVLPAQCTSKGGMQERDAKFCAESHANIPILNDEIRRLRAERVEYEHYVMTGRNEQHDRLVSELDRLRAEVERLAAERDAMTVMSASFVFDDWIDTIGDSVYYAKPELTSGSLHHGTTFDGQIAFDDEERDTIFRANSQGVRAVFYVDAAMLNAAPHPPAAPVCGTCGGSGLCQSPKGATGWVAYPCPDCPKGGEK